MRNRKEEGKPCVGSLGPFLILLRNLCSPSSLIYEHLCMTKRREPELFTWVIFMPAGIQAKGRSSVQEGLGSFPLRSHPAHGLGKAGPAASQARAGVYTNLYHFAIILVISP